MGTTGREACGLAAFPDRREACGLAAGVGDVVQLDRAIRTGKLRVSPRFVFLLHPSAIARMALTRKRQPECAEKCSERGEIASPIAPVRLKG